MEGKVSSFGHKLTVDVCLVDSRGITVIYCKGNTLHPGGKYLSISCGDPL